MGCFDIHNSIFFFLFGDSEFMFVHLFLLKK